MNRLLLLEESLFWQQLAMCKCVVLRLQKALTDATSYCQMAQQYMDKFLGIGSFFAKVAEKGHRFKNNMSALGAAVKLT